MLNFDLKTYLLEKKSLINAELKHCVPEQKWPQRLHEAIHYSLEAGGKRLRPILMIAAAEACGGSFEQVRAAAIAIEMIHTYSLIHDDLPAMDNDDLRRGKPTSHKVFGEGLAILAGDALLTEAFRLLARFRHPQLSSTTLLETIEEIAQASGTEGMVAGQAVDLESEGKQLEQKALAQLHQHKTGKLISVSVTAGGKLVGADASQLSVLREYGEKIGLAFQVMDDILDLEGGEELGKTLKSDLAKNKSTYPSLMGLDASKQLSYRLVAESIQCLNGFDRRADPLRSIASYVIERRG